MKQKSGTDKGAIERSEAEIAAAEMLGTDRHDRIAGIILAAGYSSRMGDFKPLLQIGNRTAVEWIADTYKKSGISSVLAVTGYKRELLVPVLEKKGIREAYNQEYDMGMFTSIQRGIREAMTVFADGPEGYFLMLADSPLVSAGVLKKIMDQHREVPEAFIVPCYQGKKGHPLFIPACFAEEILDHKGEGGLKAVTSRHEDRMIKLEVGDESVVLDMDTPQGYQELLDYYEERSSYAQNRGIDWDEAGETASGEQDAGLKLMLQGKRLFLVRHGEIRQHSEKIFLGQTDVPLSEKGRQQAAEAAEELLGNEARPLCIYSSDLLRAAETAELIRARFAEEENLSELSIICDSRLREMSLGCWDGCFIREIMEQYPEEYKRRGENLLTYKFDHSSENFYDLQYRAMKALRGILKQERAIEIGQNTENKTKDIVIVSHWGVINVILCRLLNVPLENGNRRPITNGGIIALDFRI
ncbi:hypothetical protein FRZ06_15295 [Anoxybacterium hadale]|uniref:Uncharacterized protein n=1 Tax=Anoxybacterium hadale TaxID=3408580 RepID=A0ACD1AE87_9FIRM|nr:hypothetical protein FRZ06_15295 [Clostridiales bacterium]